MVFILEHSIKIPVLFSGSGDAGDISPDASDWSDSSVGARGNSTKDLFNVEMDESRWIAPFVSLTQVRLNNSQIGWSWFYGFFIQG